MYYIDFSDIISKLFSNLAIFFVALHIGFLIKKLFCHRRWDGLLPYIGAVLIMSGGVCAFLLPERLFGAVLAALGVFLMRRISYYSCLAWFAYVGLEIALFWIVAAGRDFLEYGVCMAGLAVLPLFIFDIMHSVSKDKENIRKLWKKSYGISLVALLLVVIGIAGWDSHFRYRSFHRISGWNPIALAIFFFAFVHLGFLMKRFSPRRDYRAPLLGVGTAVVIAGINFLLFRPEWIWGSFLTILGLLLIHTLSYKQFLLWVVYIGLMVFFAIPIVGVLFHRNGAAAAFFFLMSVFSALPLVLYDVLHHIAKNKENTGRQWMAAYLISCTILIVNMFLLLV